MRKLIAVVIATAFVAGTFAPMAWAQGAGAKSETKPAAAATKPAEKTADAKPAAKAAEKKAKLDINAAPDADLKALGLSDDEVKKVVDGRPWKRKDELVKKNVISKETYAKVKDEIIAHQPKAAAKAKTEAAPKTEAKTEKK